MKGNKIILLLLFLLAFSLRLYGLNWDQGQHLHPDERFLTMVVSDIKLPNSLFQYFDSGKSPLNPYNNNYNFYVYGTFPLLITRIFAQLFKLASYDQIFFVGRILSAFFDSLTAIVIFYMSFNIFKKYKTAYLSTFLYAICILPIQQSHFFTVDSFTVFFFAISLLLIVTHKYLFAGIFFGLTLACKTSVVIILPVIFIYVFIDKKLSKTLLFLLATIISFRIFQPYAFDGLINLSPHFLANISDAHKMITGEIDYPPNVYWKNSLPLIHPIINIFFVGLGPITFILFIFGTIKVICNLEIKKHHNLILLLSIIIIVFFYHSLLLAKYMRYFYPIYPLLITIAGYGLSIFNKKNIVYFFIANICITILFINIYSSYHSRYQASEWICQNIPTNSILSSELWDDSLPLYSKSCDGISYIHYELPLFDPDTTSKWQNLNRKLNDIDYLILSSNRLWGSIPKIKSVYPVTSVFYQNLFEGETDFKLYQRFYSYPGFPLPFINNCILIGKTNYPYTTTKNKIFEIDNKCTHPGIYFRDDSLEESFTVYDHPQILVFKRQKI